MIPIDIVNIIIGFGISACAYGIVVFAFFQRGKKETVIDNKSVEEQIVKKDVSGSTDNAPVLFTLDEVEKIIFEEGEDWQTHEPGDKEYDGLLFVNNDNTSLLSTLYEVEKIISLEDENGKIHDPVEDPRPALSV